MSALTGLWPFPKEEVMPKEDRKENPNKISLTVVVSGEETEVEANVHAPLQTVVRQALEQTGNDTGRTIEEWVLTDREGNPLDVARKIETYGFTDGTRLYLSPKIGAGG